MRRRIAGAYPDSVHAKRDPLDVMNESAPVSCRVLVVEDEPATLMATADYLAGLGHYVKAAADSQSAREEVERHCPEVVICDWRLGAGEDGVELARDLQQNMDVKIIFTTGYPIDDLRKVTQGLDVSDYFQKPVFLRRLADAIAKFGCN